MIGRALRRLSSRGWPRRRVVVKLRGGLGNQMFQYAVARRLADTRGAELWLDASEFERDTVYQRRYSLSCFEIRADRILERPFALARWRPRLLLEEPRIHADEELGWARFREGEPILALSGSLLDPEPSPWIILDGSWQSEVYFADAANAIRRDFRVKDDPTAGDPRAAEILSTEAVCLGIRRYEEANAARLHSRLPVRYYERAVEHVLKHTRAPHFFVFSTDVDWARSELRLPGPVTYLEPERAPERAHLDLALMSRCRHFVIPNSTYHWWGAWLGSAGDKIVVAPREGWGNRRPTPPGWVALPALGDGAP
jgi:hypothetical protein